MTIQEVFQVEKSAEFITQMSPDIEPDDYGYTKTVVDAAMRLHRAGLGPFEYMTQWGSGTTLWQYHNATVTVKLDGTIG